MKTYSKIAALLLAAIMLVTFAVPAANAKSMNIPRGQLKKITRFKDVDDTLEWANLAIDRMYARGVIKGYPGDAFKPKSNVTHLEAIIMSLRVMGWEEEAKNTKINDDIKKIKLPWDDAYYYVALAVKKGLIKPEELKNFNPNAPAKRYEIARYIVRALDLEDEAKEHMGEKLSFKDAAAIPKDVTGYVYVMLDLELMKGDDNNKFKPNEPITRAEMAVMLNRLDGSLESEDKSELVGTIKKIDIDNLTITLQNSFGTKTYNLLKNTPVYVDGKYKSLKDLKVEDKVELVLDADKYAVFIQVIEKAESVTTTTEGLIVDVDASKKSVTLFTYGKYKEGFVGTLKLSSIEGKHYELETKRDRYVLVGDIDELEDYVDEKIVVFGEISDDESIYMRGLLIDVEDVYPLKSKYITTFYIDGNTNITIDGEKAGFFNLTEGDYAEVKAEDKMALEIKAKTPVEPKKIVVSADGLVVEVSKKSISLVTYIQDLDEGFIGILRENDVEGTHYELETNQGTFVLKGNVKGLKDYIGEKIVVKGELTDEISIFMRGYIIDVEEFYLLRNRDFVVFDVDDSTKITIDGDKAKLSEIEIGDYAEIYADADNIAAEIKAYSRTNRIKEWEKEIKNTRDGKLTGKVVSKEVGSKCQLVIQNDDGKFTLVIDKDVKLKGLKSLSRIKKGMQLELSIKDGKIIEIAAVD
ncbi:S-layer domain-containing protein [Tepidanaerobacter acetatoxydans Re1]|uniref:S-layer domain-containing protein n=1 Tax=Tepidanaerobacter acetatoxydans (strain DSM 21804 / JCM 16047 / Re1) TaxID=1209989 RepID=F4LTF9_TEPAE|nr:S-layer homology domain-containing protein [Tepidanaerobacter acetatoxydans]AEE90490.1 S-layer domain-containing protein [Tepidanaerobacter acetatoxydans Re1]CCP24996.1 S-layer domain-containing protein [Tepidanaerobacter acetatoxydans Re1]